jgi:6,7-dimethyl-8-ribityllumazine synthase
MPYQEIDALTDGQDLKVAIIVAKFNELVTKRLLTGALNALDHNGVTSSKIKVFWVSGAFEIPTVAMAAAQSHKFDTVICLGAVIRGETSHFDYVSIGVTTGVAQIPLTTDIPTAFGILTTDTLEQALARSGSNDSNRGYDAAVSVLKTVNTIKQI